MQTPRVGGGQQAVGLQARALPSSGPGLNGKESGSSLPLPPQSAPPWPVAQLLFIYLGENSLYIALTSHNGHEYFFTFLLLTYIISLTPHPGPQPWSTPA